MQRTKCEICGKVILQAAFEEIDMCKECKESYRLQDTEQLFEA